jgi:hypothetical protein
VMSPRPLPPSQNDPAEITGNRFPQNLETALTAEIAEVRRRARVPEPQA